MGYFPCCHAEIDRDGGDKDGKRILVRLFYRDGLMPLDRAEKRFAKLSEALEYVNKEMSAVEMCAAL